MKFIRQLLCWHEWQFFKKEEKYKWESEDQYKPVEVWKECPKCRKKVDLLG